MSLLIAWRNVIRDWRRALATILIIAVGQAALLVGGGFVLTAYDSLQEIAKRTQGQVMVVARDALAVGGVDQRLTLTAWQTISDALWSDPRVVRVLPRAEFEGLIRHGALTATFSGTGVDAQNEFKVYGPFLNIPQGELLTPWLSPNDMAEVMLGEQLAQTLQATIGDVLTLHTFRTDGSAVQLPVKLVGLFKTGTPELDDHTLTVTLDSVQNLLGHDRISVLSVYLDLDVNIDEFQQQLQQQLGEQARVITWLRGADVYLGVKALYDRIFSVAGLIIIVVVFLAISNTVALAVYQRRDEIATLGALGAAPLTVCRQFLLEALLLGVIAVGAGLMLGYGVASAINFAELWMPPPPGRSVGYPLYISVSWVHYLAIAAGLLLVTALAALVSVRQATRVNIARALS